MDEQEYQLPNSVTALEPVVDSLAARQDVKENQLDREHKLATRIATPLERSQSPQRGAVGRLDRAL